MTKVIFRVFGLALPLALSACARVQPWEKEALSEPRMRFSQDSDAQHFVDHAIITQEQAEGGSGGAGGGCGCR